jgi:ZIP family zinc transporter
MLLTVLAGLSTGIGGIIALFGGRNRKGFLAASLGFSAGVMIYVSFVELMHHAEELLPGGADHSPGGWLRVVGFFGGVLVITLIDSLVPARENPHEGVLVEEAQEVVDGAGLRRLTFLTALAIGIHNFPEGIATFFSAMSDPALGLSIAVAIALHNIPEGIAIAVPAHFATGSRKKALGYAFLSGLSEPLGAILGFLALRPFLNDTVLGMVYAGVAGIMVFISVDQLVPNAKKYAEGHQAVYGLIAGMGIMALILLII